MWPAETCGAHIPPKVTQNNNNEYTPPQKKQKDSTGHGALNEALECCKNHEIGIEEASLLYGIPKRTLRTKLKNDNFSVIDEKYKIVVLPVFPAQAECDLVDCLQLLLSSQVLFSPTEVRRLGLELVCEKYKIANLPVEKNSLLGQRWYTKFISQHPQLDVKHQLLMTHSQKSELFFNILERIVTRHRIDSSRIFFVDGIELKFRACSAEDLKIFHKRKTIYTDAKAICCTNPNGFFIPPIFLKPFKNCSPESNLNDKGPMLNFRNNLNNVHQGTICDTLSEICDPNNKYLPTSEDLTKIKKEIKAYLNKKLQPMSEKNEEELREKLYEQFSQLKNKMVSKYENTLNEVTFEIFYDWFVEFINYVKPNPQMKILLLLSNQNYIIHYKTLELAATHGVLFLVLPSHSVHKIYPLDGFAMSLNRNLSTSAACWLGKNLDFKVQQVPLHALFRKAYSETTNPVIAKNGFLYSGIWPINRNIFNSSELGGQSILLQKNSQMTINESCMKATINCQNNSRLSDNIIESDLQKLCRVCMKEKMYMKPLFELPPSTEPNHHGKKISEILNRLISSDDGLPSSICQYCLVQLMDTVKIKTLATESFIKQLKLREAKGQYFDEEESEEKRILSLFECEPTQPNYNKIMNRVLAKDFDMNSICRICMKEKPLMTSIFFKSENEETFSPDISGKIVELSQCQVHIRDGLSSFICPFCRASVNQASALIQKVLNSDKRFREIVDQRNQKN